MKWVALYVTLFLGKIFLRNLVTRRGITDSDDLASWTGDVFYNWQATVWRMNTIKNPGESCIYTFHNFV